MSETIFPNTTLAHYTIISKIGAGGMGEVYCARDTRLHREVAIKLLPANLSTDPDRLMRFEQEARATSALNHPNILTVYDIGTYQGSPYIVAELLNGEELRDRLEAGTIPVRKVIDYAQQIVSGLSAAHEKGIVHRDLKPENLFITTDDRVKILDFGLAKLTGKVDRSGPEDATRKAMTDPGVVMGTIGYMSPEQVKALDTDHRSDIFSFGAILHEMITGKRAFQRESMAETMAAILREEPVTLSETNPNLNPSIERIVERCLEKKPERRFHSAHDLGFALESLSAPTSSSGIGLVTAAHVADVSEPTPSVWRARVPWILAAVSLAGFLALLAFVLFSKSQRTETTSGVVRFTVPAPENVSNLLSFDLSPDGRYLAYSALKDGKGGTWLRAFNSLDVSQLPGTENGSGSMFWSPDSRSIAFPADGQLKRLELSGGSPKVLCQMSGRSARGGTWNKEGVILFNSGSDIFRVPANGGKPELVVGGEAKAEGPTSSSGSIYRWPVFLPDGRHFLYVRTDRDESGLSELFITSIDGGEKIRLTDSDSHALYTAVGGGNLIYARNGTLVAHPFDAASFKLSGDPVTIADKVNVSVTGNGFFSVSDNGTLVLDPSGSLSDQVLEWVDRTGKPLGQVGDKGNFAIQGGNQKLSPDGNRIAVSKLDPQTKTRDLFVIDIARGTTTKLTFDPADDVFPLWSPDGSRVVWASNRDGGVWSLYQKLSSGVGQDELLLKTEVRVVPTSWSPDGKFLLYQRTDPKTAGDLWVLPLEGDRKPFVFLQTPFAELAGRFSPDGRHVMYMSLEQGGFQIFVQTFPASDKKWQVSNNGGLQGVWRNDGKEIFYLAQDGKMMSVEVKTGSSFDVGIPKVLFDPGPGRLSLAFKNFTPSNDGQRFLFTRQRDTQTSWNYVVVQNWASELRK